MILVILAGALAGCGGGAKPGSGSKATGTVQLHILWPARSRAGGKYIPAYASSLFFELSPKGNPAVIYTLIVNRPAGTNASTADVSFSQLLSAGTYELAGAARALADAQGATVASGAVEVNVQPGINPVALTLNSTVKTLTILGQPLTAGVGQTITLQSGAFDPDGNGLLLPDGALVWSVVSGGQFGSITPAGVLTATAAGTVRVKVSEPVTGVNAQADLVISSQTVNTGLAQSGYPRAGADAATSGTVQGGGAAGQIAWTFPLGHRGVNTPVLGNNNLIFALQQKGIVYAIDATSGMKQWQMTLPNLLGDITTGSLLVGDDNTVYVVYDFGVQAYDSASGLPKWTNSDFQATGAANLSGGKLYVPSRDQGVGVIDSRTGATLLTFPGLTATYDVAIANGIAYYVTETVGGLNRGADLNAISLATGSLVWTKHVSIQTGGGFVGSYPVIGPDGTVYVSLDGAILNAFDGMTGGTKGSVAAFVTTSSARPAFAADGSVFFQQFVSGGLKTVHYDSGLTQQLGVSTAAVRQMSVGPDTVWYGGGLDTDGSGNSAVFAVNGSDGTLKWKVPLTAGVPAAPTQFGQVSGSAAVSKSGMVYVVSIDQVLYAIK